MHEEEHRPLVDAHAVRDAEELVRRAAADEADAAEARRRFRVEGLPRLDADDDLRPELRDTEDLVGRRPSVLVERHLPGERIDEAGGTLYLTTTRILVLGRRSQSIELDDVEEIDVVGERLLLRLRGGIGVAIQTVGPRLLRTEIAAAIESARA